MVSIVHALFKKEGAWWKAVTILLAIPVVVGALVAVATYNFVAVQYLRDINFAKNIAPIVYSGLVETRDSLNRIESERYHFPPLQYPK